MGNTTMEEVTKRLANDNLAFVAYVRIANDENPGSGTLTAQSRLGRGSTFTLTLPGTVRRDPARLEAVARPDASPPRVA